MRKGTIEKQSVYEIGKKYFCFYFFGRFTKFNIKETPYNIL